MSQLFNSHRDSRVPELCDRTCEILSQIWEDDFESFELVNPEDDPVFYVMLIELDKSVRKNGDAYQTNILKELMTRYVELTGG